MKKATKTTESYKLAPIELDPPRLSADWIDEPGLLFADGHEHLDPKVGIPLYEPRSLGTRRHKREVHIGLIGTSESAELARRYYEQASLGVDGDDVYEPFPGCRADRGFRCDLLFDRNLVELISRSEHQDILSISRSRERFEKLLLVLELKLRLLTQKDHPLDYIILALPTDLYQRCRVTDYVEKGVGHIQRDLRRSFKAMAMQYQKPTQILLDSTTGLIESGRELGHPSAVAWDLFTGMYFKIDGLPWFADRPRPRQLLHRHQLLPPPGRKLDPADQRGPGVRRERGGSGPAGPPLPLGRAAAGPVAAPDGGTVRAPDHDGPGSLPGRASAVAPADRHPQVFPVRTPGADRPGGRAPGAGLPLRPRVTDADERSPALAGGAIPAAPGDVVL